MLRQLRVDLWARLVGLFGRRSLHSRVTEEIETHIAMREERLIDRGVPAADARRQARIEFGNAMSIREATVESWPFQVLDALRQDVRQALRGLSRTPGFTAAAVVTIALGIGVNSGVFSIVNALLFSDLQAPDAHQLITIDQTVEGGEFTARAGFGTFSVPEYHAYRDFSETLSGVLALADPRETTLGGDEPRKIFGAIVSCNYFDVLGQPPVLGRALTAEDCRPGADPVVVLGHRFWMSTYSADSGVLGQTIELQRNLFTVVGVAAERTFNGMPMQTGYFAPLSAEPLLSPFQSRFEDDRSLWLNLIGRRNDDASLEQVRSELGVIAAQIDRQEPGRSTTLEIRRATRMPVPPDMRGVAVGASAVLMIAFGFVLLIACANVANLLLARGSARTQEIGIRLSLGASRAQIVRQLITESLMFSIAGGLLGSLMAVWSFRTLVALGLPQMVPPEVPGVVLDLDLSPDFTVLSFAIALTLATGLLVGLAPALQVSRPDLNTVIKRDTAGSGRERKRLRGVLIGVQVALSMLLMIATGLIARGWYATYTVDPGFNYQNVLHPSFGTDGGPPFLDQSMVDEVAALAGVDAVAFSTQTPLGEARLGVSVRLPGQGEDQARFVEADYVTPGYFSLLEIPILRGRTFTTAEVTSAASGSGTSAAIVSETTARNYWGNTNPIGQTLVRGDGVVLEVVGVAADAQLTAPGTIEPYYLYQPRSPGGELLVRTRSPAATAAGIRTIIEQRDPTVAFQMLTLEDNVAWFRGASGIIATLGAALGVLALVLSSVGIYGVVAYSVTRRYREIGIRMALGARARDVLNMLLRQTMGPVGVGAVIGVLAALAVSRVLSSVLFGISPTDPLGIGSAALLVFGVGLAAGVLAARPATRVDPTRMLRYD